MNFDRFVAPKDFSMEIAGMLSFSSVIGGLIFVNEVDSVWA